MMTVSKEILMHPDFTVNLADELCEMLEALIDAEFDKGDDTDFDFIDECADAINAIRSGDNALILPLISRKAFLKKVGIKGERKIKILVAAAAAIAILFTAGTQIEVEENVTIAQALSGIVSDFFTDEKQLETTTQPAETTAQATTTAQAELINISIETTPDFRTEYYVGEKFSDEGLRVFGEYDNGERRLVRIDDYTVEVSDAFGTQPKYETVKITAQGFTQTLEVRIIESVETKKLTSIYAIFPEDFSFTAKDLDNIDLTQMQVYAVYSNGDETELTAGEYTLDIEIEKSFFKEEAFVTIGYEGCTCSFMVAKE